MVVERQTTGLEEALRLPTALCLLPLPHQQEGGGGALVLLGSAARLLAGLALVTSLVVLSYFSHWVSTRDPPVIQIVSSLSLLTMIGNLLAFIPWQLYHRSDWARFTSLLLSLQHSLASPVTFRFSCLPEVLVGVYLASNWIRWPDNSANELALLASYWLFFVLAFSWQRSLVILATHLRELRQQLHSPSVAFIVDSKLDLILINFERLYLAAKLCNRLFSLHLLLMTAVIFFHETIDLYSFHWAVVHRAGIPSYLTYCSFVLFEFYGTYLLISPSAALFKESTMWVVVSGCDSILREISRLPYLIGVFPFTSAEGCLRLSRSCLLRSLLAFGLLLVHGTAVVLWPSSAYIHSPLLYLAYIIQQIAARLALFTSIFWMVIQKKSLINFVEILSKIEVFLSTRHRKITLEIYYIKDFIIFLIISLLALNHLLIRNINAWNVLKLYDYYFSMAALLAAGLQFHRLVALLSACLRQLSATLKPPGGNPPRAAPLSFPPLERALLHFDSLFSAATLLDFLFGPQVLLMMACSFLISTSNIYFTYQSLLLGENPWSSFLRVGWAVVFLALAYFLVSTCVGIARQAKEFNNVLYQLMIDDKTNVIANNKKLRLHIAMKREIVFTACGFFKLDFTLLHSMIAAATTYVVILIQFGGSDPVSTTELASTTPPLLGNSTQPSSSFFIDF